MVPSHLVPWLVSPFCVSLGFPNCTHEKVELVAGDLRTAQYLWRCFSSPSSS